MKTLRDVTRWLPLVASTLVVGCGPMPEEELSPVATQQQAARCEDCETGGGGGGTGGGTTGPVCGDGICASSETHCSCARDCADDETAMVRTFAPLFRLHSGENNLPAGVEWYLARTTLRFNHDGGCGDESVLAAGQVTVDNLVTQQRRTRSGWPWCSAESTTVFSNTWGGSDEFFFLQIPNDEWEGVTRHGDSWGTTWKAYAHVRHEGAGWSIQYWVFYPYNGMSPGEHEGDWEHVTVQVADDRTTPLSVYYAAHDAEGQSLTWSAVEKSGTHPIVYVANGSHASYPHAGWTDRGYPLPNDFHDGQGRTFDATDRVVHLGGPGCNYNGQGWLRYSGRWGEVGEFFSGPFSPLYQPYWNAAGK